MKREKKIGWHEETDFLECVHEWTESNPWKFRSNYQKYLILLLCLSLPLEPSLLIYLGVKSRISLLFLGKWEVQRTPRTIHPISTFSVNKNFLFLLFLSLALTSSQRGKGTQFTNKWWCHGDELKGDEGRERW